MLSREEKQMKKENMLTYIEKQLEKRLGAYDFAIDWDTKNHTVEIIVVLYAHNQKSIKVEDLEGIVSEEEVIEFEDSLLLVNPDKSQYEEEEYLAVLPYEGKKGMKKGQIDNIATYLAEVLIEGESDLLDFLQDEEQEVFELEWNDATFKKMSVGNQDYVVYPNY